MRHTLTLLYSIASATDGIQVEAFGMYPHRDVTTIPLSLLADMALCLVIRLSMCYYGHVNFTAKWSREIVNS